MLLALSGEKKMRWAGTSKRMKLSEDTYQLLVVNEIREMVDGGIECGSLKLEG